MRIFKQTILPILDYRCIIWDQCGEGNDQKLERLQNRALRIILSTSRKTCSQDMRNKLGLLSLCSSFLRLQMVFKIVNNVHCPSQLRDYLQLRSSKHNRNLRDSLVLHILWYKTSLGQTSFKYMAAKIRIIYQMR